jgi:hypothetical protein
MATYIRGLRDSIMSLYEASAIAHAPPRERSLDERSSSSG